MKISFFRRNIIVAGMLFPIVITGPAFAFQGIWNKSFGSNNHFASGREVAVYNAKQVALTGIFQGKINFGLNLHVAQGTQDIFLALFDVNGTPLWSKSFGASTEKCSPAAISCSSNTDVQSVIFDQLGNVIIIGHSDGAVDFGGGKITGDSFFAKFDSQGNHLGSKGYRNVYFRGIAIDSTNNIVISGDQSGTQLNGYANLGCGNLAANNGSNDVLLAKLTPSGQCLWNKTLGGTSNDAGTRVIVEGGQNIVLAGNFDNQVYTAKFDPNGNPMWVKKFGAGTVADLAGNGSKEILLTGDFSGNNLNFGNGALQSNAGSVDIFVAKLDAQGNEIWSQRFGNSATDHAKSIATHGSKIYVTGSCIGLMSSPSLNCTSGVGSPDDIFVMKLNQDGSYLKGRRFGDNNTQIGTSIAVSSTASPINIYQNNNYIFVTGYFNNKLDFGISPILNSIGSEDAFLVKFDIFELLLPKWNINDGPKEPRYTGCPIGYEEIVIPLEGDISENTFQLVEPTRAGPITINYAQKQLEYALTTNSVGVDQATFAITDIQTGKIRYATFTIEMAPDSCENSVKL